MNIYQLIEELHLYQQQLKDEHLYQLVPEYEIEKWIELAKFFIAGIEHQHNIPGKILLNLAGICDWYREHEMITQKQQYYLVRNIIKHWDQLSCRSRAKLIL